MNNTLTILPPEPSPDAPTYAQLVARIKELEAELAKIKRHDARMESDTREVIGEIARYAWNNAASQGLSPQGAVTEIGMTLWEVMERHFNLRLAAALSAQDIRVKLHAPGPVIEPTREESTKGLSSSNAIWSDYR